MSDKTDKKPEVETPLVIIVQICPVLKIESQTIHYFYCIKATHFWAGEFTCAYWNPVRPG